MILGSIKHCDFIFGIQVHDATFAYMHCGGVDYAEERGRHFDMVKVDNIFTNVQQTINEKKESME